ncbi:dihydrofolate reductase family protein [Glutamicibacter sp. PS]|uniref:dihydrofolate reductase family protein n=1 Tax=Glutamicibacter sp. PS TaxID=3075634 RepID=UPI00284D96E4|nr:dihydrofolate reductase family protein [Glutamicibacter sp. PS]MDR4534107.1 dihydrofolate reductase family protein [Glutamicibacter sp. PS]
MAVIADISVSLDGFVTGPNPGLENGLGDGGSALHRWAFSDNPQEQQLVARATERSGAVVLGRKLFDIVDGPGGWNEEVGYGASLAATPPFVVVTSQPPRSVRLSQLDWTFSTGGLAEAISMAASRVKDPAQDVVLMGGGLLIGTALQAGLIDQLHLHVAPVLLGAGTPLFRDGGLQHFAQREVLATENATHLVYEPA